MEDYLTDNQIQIVLHQFWEIQVPLVAATLMFAQGSSIAVYMIFSQGHGKKKKSKRARGASPTNAIDIDAVKILGLSSSPGSG